MQTLNIDELAERLADWQQELPWPVEDLAIAAAAIAELAEGEPVDVAQIAARADRPAPGVLDFLRRSPAEFDDDGRLVGFGLTLRPTPHRVELDGRVLYTWCAPDTLELPVMLGKPVRIESPCFATGETIRIGVDPDGVRAVDPEQAVVSIVTPDDCLSDFRERACDEQHFFASAEAAAGWQAERPGAIVVPVHDGFALTRGLTARWFGTGAASDAF
ncbi:MAG: organomercurial lyase MerB, partial [Solirubrobacteraceae bacterium]